MYKISDDAKTILLLCGRLGGDSEAKPLQQREYNQLVQWLLEQGLRPADMLVPDIVIEAAKGTRLPETRLTELLNRGVQLGFAIEKWNQGGIWVICRSDPEYPTRLKKHLKDKSPPILFCVGERSLLQGGGLAIVGSRNVDNDGEEFTKQVSAWCAHGGLPVVSGGARGVDQIAMKSALDAGGCVIGILADNLLKKSVSRDVRYAISEERLLLFSPYHPEAHFMIGSAMGRNKLIYAMADYGLVISAEHNKGGTWAGAVEELKRKKARPVFVHLSGSVPPGNTKLIEQGAFSFPEWNPDSDPLALLKGEIDRMPKKHSYKQELFTYAARNPPIPQTVEEPETPM